MAAKTTGSEAVERIENRIGPQTRFELTVTGPLTEDAMRRLVVAVGLFAGSVSGFEIPELDFAFDKAEKKVNA
jgi:hypothetical protein